VKTYHSIPGKDLNNINLLLEKQYAKKQMLSFIGISKTITQISLELFPNSKIQTIENGIPLPKEPSITRKPVIYDFVIVASLEPVKNHMLLFHAFQRYVCFYKDAILAVVGSGSRENVYRKYVADNNLSNNVIFFGEIDDVSIALSKSRVFILSSTQEGNPISILEALSLGLPIIAPRVGGIPDIVKEDANGLLFESKNENELLNCMLKLSSSHQLYDTISATNIRYSKRFSIKKTMNSYVRFFDNLIK
jgi:glycosyltransferase involved in cell wall biosynthesis